MRHLIALAFCFLLAPTQVYACLGPFSEEHLFFDTIPTPQPDADVIAEISISDVNIRATASSTARAMATVTRVLKTSDARVHQGDKFTMQYRNSSCGPDPEIGSKGMIIARTGTDSKGSLVLHPYTHRDIDSRINPPAMLPDGFDTRPSPLRIGEGIPQNFAVILIGVVGAEPVLYLSFRQSADAGMVSDFSAQSNTIVAIAIPVGIKQLSISGITSGRRRAGNLPNDSAGVNTPKLDIDRPGLYYVATLDTDHLGQFQTAPLPEQLKQFHADYAGTVESLEPINFKWPSQ